MASIDELAKKVDDLTKQRRNNSRQAGPAKETTPESEAAGTSPSGSDHGEDADSISVQVWNEMFEDKPFYDISGDSEFLKNKVCGLISPEQVTRLGETVIADIDARKDSFIKTKDTDRAKLRK